MLTNATLSLAGAVVLLCNARCFLDLDRKRWIAVISLTQSGRTSPDHGCNQNELALVDGSGCNGQGYSTSGQALLFEVVGKPEWRLILRFFGAPSQPVLIAQGNADRHGFHFPG